MKQQTTQTYKSKPFKEADIQNDFLYSVRTHFAIVPVEDSVPAAQEQPLEERVADRQMSRRGFLSGALSGVLAVVCAYFSPSLVSSGEYTANPESWIGTKSRTTTTEKFLLSVDANIEALMSKPKYIGISDYNEHLFEVGNTTASFDSAIGELTIHAEYSDNQDITSVMEIHDSDKNGEIEEVSIYRWLGPGDLPSTYMRKGRNIVRIGSECCVYGPYEVDDETDSISDYSFSPGLDHVFYRNQEVPRRTVSPEIAFEPFQKLYDRVLEIIKEKELEMPKTR